jgi:DNA-binding NarL/FixJ family response regulator
MSSSVVTIAVCDSEPIVVEGLRFVLAASGDLRLVAALTSLVDAGDSLRASRPALLLVDKVFGVHVVMDWLKALRESDAQTRAVVWGLNLNDVESLRFLQAGAAGVIRKTASVPELLKCLRTVAAGGTWLEGAPIEAGERGKRSGHTPLTARELQVMELVERGFKNKDIASGLGICTGTVKIHLKHIFEKTGIRGRYGLALNGLKDKGLLAQCAAEEAA